MAVTGIASCLVFSFSHPCEAGSASLWALLAACIGFALAFSLPRPSVGQYLANSLAVAFVLSTALALNDAGFISSGTQCYRLSWLGAYILVFPLFVSLLLVVGVAGFALIWICRVVGKRIARLPS